MLLRAPLRVENIWIREYRQCDWLVRKIWSCFQPTHWPIMLALKNSLQSDKILFSHQAVATTLFYIRNPHSLIGHLSAKMFFQPLWTFLSLANGSRHFSRSNGAIRRAAPSENLRTPRMKTRKNRATSTIAKFIWRYFVECWKNYTTFIDGKGHRLRLLLLFACHLVSIYFLDK